MKRNKHLLLWSSLGVLTLLIAAAVQENFLKEWRQIQAAVRADSGPLDVRLRQVVVPKLNVTDRCVSCHVGMAPGERGVSGSSVLAAHPPVVHDPGEYGCTVCHGGQGRATDQADAHGEVPFWPQPMIPAEYAYAGCGSCHTHVRVPNQTQLARGQSLLERHDCLACHRIDGRGGTLRPGGEGGMEGPDLSTIGAAGVPADWYSKHLAKYEAAADGVWRTSFGPIDEASRTAIGEYLASRVGAGRLVQAKALFHSLGCRGCHKVGGVGGGDGPELTLTGDKDPGRLDFAHVSGERSVAHWHAEHLRNPAQVVPGSQMPKLGLTDEQVDLLVLYLLSLRRSNFPEAYWPQDRIRVERFGEREFATDGETLFAAFCAACHGRAGEGRRFPGAPLFPAVGNPDLLAAATDAFLADTIAQGRPGRRMPAWGEPDGGLRPEEIAAIVSHLRRQAGVAEPQPARTERRWVTADARLGQRLYAAYCSGCHGPQGEGLLAPQLNNRGLLAAASDSYFVETIGLGRRGTLMPSFRSGSPLNPALSAAEIEAIVAFLRTWEK